MSLQAARQRLKRLQIQAIGTKGKVTPGTLRKVDREILLAIRDIVKGAISNTECSNCCGKPDACTRRGPQVATEPMTSSLPSQKLHTSYPAKPTKEPRLRLNVAKRPAAAQKPAGYCARSKAGNS